MEAMGDPGLDEVRAYYETEADRRLRRAPIADRADFRRAFIEQMRSEGRSSVVGAGSGPGFDGAHFVEHGLRFVGLDLAVGNARIAAEMGVIVVPASITDPPLRPRSFDAAWSMSTLMHLDDDSAARAASAIAALVRPGGPFWIGVWGGDDQVVVDDTTIEGRLRPYRLRTIEHNRRLFEPAADVETATVHDLGPDGQHYQLLCLRCRE